MNVNKAKQNGSRYKRTKFPDNKKSHAAKEKSSRIRRGVHIDTKKKRAESKKSPQWLNKSIDFNHNLKLKEEYQDIVQEILEKEFVTGSIKNKDQKITDLNVLLANLINKKDGRPIRVSLNRNNWTKTVYRRAGDYTRKLIKMMNDQRYILMRKGYKTPKESRQTRIWPSRKLLAFFDQLPETSDFVEYDPVQLVELRKFKGHYKKKPTKEHSKRHYKKLYEPVEYEETNKSLRVRKILKKVNEVNKSADIRYKDGIKTFKTNTSIVAIYIDNFSHYGRLHSRGAKHYQMLSSKEKKGIKPLRPTITINGNETTELDYSALHPNLLYAAKGIQYVGDPYTAAHPDPAVRNFLKMIVLCMINSSSFNEAQAAANNWLVNDDKSNYKELLEVFEKPTAKPLMEAMIKAHPEIAEFFCADSKVAMKLMNKDAAIALDVVSHFADKGIPILPVHDSFIVEKQHCKELKLVMQKTYRKHTKGFRIKVK